MTFLYALRGGYADGKELPEAEAFDFGRAFKFGRKMAVLSLTHYQTTHQHRRAA